MNRAPTWIRPAANEDGLMPKAPILDTPNSILPLRLLPRLGEGREFELHRARADARVFDLLEGGEELG